MYVMCHDVAVYVGSIVLRGAAWCCVVMHGDAWCCEVLLGAAGCSVTIIVLK